MKSLHFSSVYYTGTLTQAVVRDLTSTVYYFKLRACTNAGKGPPSDVVKVVLNPCIRPCDGGNSSPPICKLATAPDLFTSSPFLWPHFMDLEFLGGKGYMIQMSSLYFYNDRRDWDLKIKRVFRSLSKFQGYGCRKLRSGGNLTDICP